MWLSNWKYRIRIRLKHDNLTEDLSNFPSLLWLSESSGVNSKDLSSIFAEIQDADKHKIAVTTSDGTTQCNVEVVSWDATNKQAELWVKVPTLSATSNTILYLYYDANQADNDTYVGNTGSTPAKAVWDANFVFVSHMNDSPDGLQALDSTANANHGTINGSVQVDGLAGKAQSFDGVDDYIDCGNMAGLIVDKLSVELFGQIPHHDEWLSESMELLGKANTGLPRKGYRLYARNNGYVYLQVASEDGTDLVVPYQTTVYGEPIHVVGVQDDEGAMVYMNSVHGSKVARTGGINEIDIYNLYIGRYAASTTYYFKGLISEVRISNIARSASWIAATNATLRDELISWGSLEAYTIPIILPSFPSVASRYRIDIKDHTGQKVAVLTEWRHLEIEKHLNGIDTHALTVDGNSYLADLIGLDYQIEVWRRNVNAGIPWYLEYEGFHRSSYRKTSGGDSSFASYGVGFNHLLSRRIICHTSSSAYTDKSGKGETVMKAYVNENAGPGATSPPRLLISGVFQGLSIEADQGRGSDWAGARAFHKLLDVCQDIANASGIDFGIVGTGPGEFEFRVRPLWGADRTNLNLNHATGLNASGNPPVVFSLDFGNMGNPEYSLNQTGEVNAVISMGEGLAGNRLVALTTRPFTDSPWNQCEAARGATNEYTTEALESGSEAFLAENQAKESFSFDVVQIPGSLYGREYYFGDLVTARYKNIERHKKIVGVRITVEGSEENISLELSDVR